MAKQSMKLWETGGTDAEIHYFPPYIDAVSDAAIIAIPGGAYRGLSQHEGYGYGEFFACKGFHVFSVDYHTIPHRFPTQLLEARRAVRFVRAHASEYGIDPHKILVIGSSAGGHLTAMLSTYTQPIEGEGVDTIDAQPFLPDAHALCYPVICCPEKEELCHMESYRNLLGGRNEELEKAVDPSQNVSESTPPAFLFHTAADQSVNVINSYEYATALRRCGVPHELHVFPTGIHGMGVWLEDAHNHQWTALLVNWIRHLGWMKEA